MKRRIAALALAVVVTLLGMTACTATPAPPSSASPEAESSASADAEAQSVAEACALVQDTIEQASKEFQDAAQDDPGAVVETMKTAAAKLGEAAEQITNEDVAAVLPGVQEMFATTAGVLQDIVQGDVSAIGKLATLGDTFRKTVQQFEDLCAPE